MGIKSTKLYQELEKRKSKYIKQVEEAYEQAKNTLEKVNVIFSNYTCHGVGHSISVMGYMYDLVVHIKQLSELELVVMMYVSLFHDIGMVCEEEEKELILKGEIKIDGKKYSSVYAHIGKENLALQEIIRPAHGKRSNNYVKKMKKELFYVPGCGEMNFQEEVALISQAHNENFDWIKKELKDEKRIGDEKINAQYIAMLLRIADYLDIDESRAPDYLYKLISPQGYGDKEWKQHYIVSNKKKIVTSESGKQIVLDGKCNDAIIYRKFLKYIDSVNKEIQQCVIASKKYVDSKYVLNVCFPIDNRIKTEGFDVVDRKFSIDYKAMLNLILGERLYGDKKYGLREILQNSIDACKVMVEKSKDIVKYKYNVYRPEIKIVIDEESNQFIIMDNGIGMTDYVLENYFLNIGVSYYRSNDYLYQGINYEPIGNFGIGFLACFMLSDTVRVETKSYSESNGISIELFKDSEYICKSIKSNIIVDSGAAVILELDSVMNVFENNIDNLTSFIQESFIESNIPIVIHDTDSNQERTLELHSWSEITKGYVEIPNGESGISIAVKFAKDKLEIDSEFYELCNIPKDKLYEFDSEEKCFVQKEITMDIAKNNYIVDDMVCVLIIRGIKKEDEKVFVEYLKQKEVVLNLQYHTYELDANEVNWYGEAYYIVLPFRKAYEKYLGGCKTIYKDSGMIFSKVSINILNEILFNKEEICKCFGLCENYRMELEIGRGIIIECGEDRYIKMVENEVNVSKIYLNGILLDRCRFKADCYLVGLSISDVVVNINDGEIKSNVSRDNLLPHDANVLKQMVEREILNYIASKYDDGVKQAIGELVKEFV